MKETRGLFSPRMDYEQWTPLGRGDPLKNDPTYDYVPPVLERVHYWIEPSLRKPDGPLPSEKQKTEILLLGVSSKKPSTGVGSTSVADSRRDAYEPYLKYVGGPIYHQNNYQRIARPHFTTYFPNFYENKPDKNYNVGKSEQRVPYTILVPPPIPKKINAVKTTKPNVTTSKVTIKNETTTTSSITVQESNLIYQSSSLGSWGESYGGESSSHVTWKTPFNVIDTTTPKTLKTSDFLEYHINQTRNATNLMPETEIRYKGQVSDGDLDIASTYVNIGKAEAQMDSSSGFGVSSVSIEPPQIVVRQPPLIIQPLTLQTMQPPPVSKPYDKKYTPNLYSLLKKEVSTTRNPLLSSFASTTSTPSASTISYTKTPSLAQIQTLPFIPTPIASSTSTSTTTTPSTTMTTTTTTTTDPLFKHYKQPSEPLKPPMYLIIQGHSKVKTYGPSKQINGINVQETNEILTTIEKNKYTVKHLHNNNNKDEHQQSSNRRGKSNNNLQTLKHVVKTGLGAINFNEYDLSNRPKDVQETVLSVGYDVSSSRKEVTSEKYHKGIVEAARKIKD